MKSRQLPTSWHTKRLAITDSIKEEIDDLRGIYDACAYIGEWSGYDDTRKNQMLREFKHENLPPHGSKRLHRLQSIRSRKKLIGYLATYHGFPDKNTLWIVVLAIHPDFQRNKFGQEIVTGLIKGVKKCGYNAIGLSVSIKNWPALRFWIKSGFTQILKFEGDKICSKKAFADVWLAREI